MTSLDTQAAETPELPNSNVTAAIARYLGGAPAKSAEFDFFVGTWSCTVTVAGPNGVSTELKGRWEARSLHEGRVIADELTLFLPDGRPCDAWLTLRTFAPETGAWEITGVRALSAVNSSTTVGRWRDGEMHLSFTTQGEDARTWANAIRFHDIRPDGFAWEWSVDVSGDGGNWQPFAKIVATREG